MSKLKKYHFIAIGGAAMHNIALDLLHSGHHVTGSDDEIYDPALSRLEAAGIAPKELGWNIENITVDIDIVVLGMHAKADNPELIRAQELELTIMSYPQLIYEMSKDKIRIVVAGSHGKTTTTAMILHVLKQYNYDFDYLVGAQLEGFDRMVRISQAPILVIEGDEYLSSPIDLVPKIHHYRPHIAVVTGIAWDHINVFPTFENYKNQFSIYIDRIQPDGIFIYNTLDPHIMDILKGVRSDIRLLPYDYMEKGSGNTVVFEGNTYSISVIGHHNLQNMAAARLVCNCLDIQNKAFLQAISSFRGAAKRLQLLQQSAYRNIFLDFAHAPSKVVATTGAVKEWYGTQKLLAVLELHTFSSLNKDFISQYHQSLDAADKAIVFYNEHTLQMKGMPALEADWIVSAFGRPDLVIITDKNELKSILLSEVVSRYNILLMTSGNFNGLDYSELK